MTDINNANDWYKVADTHREPILEMMTAFGYNCDQPKPILTDDPPCIRVGESIRQAYTRLVRDRDPEAARLMHRLWAGLPDRPEIHSHSGFSPLCSLCSEDWALQPDHPYYEV
jgi:hypothetical protein